MGRQYTLRRMAHHCRPQSRLLAALIIVATALLVLALPMRPQAHEIPNDVTVHAFLRPEGQRLRLLVRAPIAAMRDILFPTRDQNNIDLARAEPPSARRQRCGSRIASRCTKAAPASARLG